MLTKYLWCLLIFSIFASENLYAGSCKRSADNFFCVGDSVMSLSQGAYSGTVKGISGSNIQIKTTSWGENDKTLIAKSDELYLTSGCFKLICVGDPSFIPGRGALRKILALNPRTESMIIEVYDGWRGVSVQFAILPFGCARGICVGDQASLVLPGEIIGIDPDSKLLIHSRKDYFSGEYAAPWKLHVFDLNPNYTPEQRKKVLFPELDESKYSIPELMFSERRPIKD